jgi:hypothetical protein
MSRLALLALGVPLSGCILLAAAVVGGMLAAGTYTYVNGEGRQDYRVSYDKLYNAVVTLAEKRGIQVADKRIDPSGRAHLQGTLKGSGTSVSFTINKLTENTSRLGIRVGTWGDEKITADLHNEVGRELEAKYK